MVLASRRWALRAAMRCRDGGDLGRPGGGDGVGGQLDDVEDGRFGLAEGAGHELELLGGGAGRSRGACLVLLGDEDVDVVDAGAETGSRNLPAMMVPGKPGLVQLKLNSVRLPGRLLVRLTRYAAADDALVGGDADVDLGGEAVGVEAGHGEPAAGIEQDADGVVDGGELDAVRPGWCRRLEGAGVFEVSRWWWCPLGSGVARVTRTVVLVVRRSDSSGLPLAAVTLVICRPLFSSKMAVVRSSSAVKVTAAVAVRWLHGGVEVGGDDVAGDVAAAAWTGAAQSGGGEEA